jgi:hypothetical protein
VVWIDMNAARALTGRRFSFAYWRTVLVAGDVG